jgi:hypothetical protein
LKNFKKNFSKSLVGIKKRYTFAPLSAPKKGVGGNEKERSYSDI